MLTKDIAHVERQLYITMIRLENESENDLIDFRYTVNNMNIWYKH